MPNTILIIDDEEGVRESLKLILGDFYPLILTDGPEAGMDVLKENAAKIGLVLLDIKMPHTSGLDFLEEIKGLYPQIPVIMVTGYNFVETATEASQRGASGYIVKPFKSDDVLKVVGKYLKNDK